MKKKGKEKTKYLLATDKREFEDFKKKCEKLNVPMAEMLRALMNFMVMCPGDHAKRVTDRFLKLYEIKKRFDEKIK